MNRHERNDYDLSSKVKAGDDLFLPITSGGNWLHKITKRNVGIAMVVVKKVTAKTIIFERKSTSKVQFYGERLRHCDGYKGWRATWDEAFKIGQAILEDDLAIYEKEIQEASRKLKSWETMDGPAGL